MNKHFWQDTDFWSHLAIAVMGFTAGAELIIVLILFKVVACTGAH